MSENTAPGNESTPQANRDRRASDRRSNAERRKHWQLDGDFNTPPWAEQRAQFLTRFMFISLATVYFLLNGPQAAWPSLPVVLIGYAIYAITMALLMYHATRQNESPIRWRAAMWVDILFISFSVTADRSTMVSPALMAYLAVILGNGMRYSMRFFREAVLGSFIVGMAALYIRYSNALNAVNLATVFVLLFGGIVILYSYSLMGRIESVKRKLESEGRVDALTGLLNRRALFEKAELLFNTLDRGEHKMAVLFADLNKFKAINDQMGHRAGDRVLVNVSQMLASSIRKSDVLARYGGDEFVLLLPDADVNQATTLAQRLQAQLRRAIQDPSIEISMSIGIAEAPRHGRDLNSVLENVDKAMYRGKLSAESSGIQCVDDVSPNPSLH